MRAQDDYRELKRLAGELPIVFPFTAHPQDVRAIGIPLEQIPGFQTF